ncbi:MBOAT family protein [Winogradskyella litoriviva]|uniref:MBOAT family protein n=1 Tax=Winogradskyella litoriviva TaxID=1220182 RepID=A0ABX2E179_9FLAO|nr:MBOAT family protein [Winogradskyella litoriviva]NRD22030.1 MBOAT family protein [Winogradskyella litoriviva]
MLFSSSVFLFLFLPITIITYYASPSKLKNFTLLLCSLFFYTWGEGIMVLLILLSTIVDYFSALIIERGKKKLGLICSLTFNLGILIYFKYTNFIFKNINGILSYLNIKDSDTTQLATIILPIGISFFTFQTMSYTIDVYRGKVKANRNLIDFATYVALFPQLIAGPIVRYSDIKKELSNRKHSFSQFSEGIKRFIIGLSKKMLIANNCGFIADGMFSLTNSDLSIGMAWIGLLAYTLQIYFDFSGYSDMAIGLGKMFGFNFPENFNFPYISKSIREFWRRWHITLSKWFKDYLYIALGGNRKGKLWTYINLSIVFFITGLWHGDNWTFILWGLFHGFFIIVERVKLQKLLEKIPSVFSHIYLILIVMLSWVLFRCESIEHALYYYKSLFSFTTPLNNDYLNFYLTVEVIISMVLGILFSLQLHKFFKDYKPFNPLIKNIIDTSVIALLFILNMFYIANESYNPFIYFRF